MAFRMGGVGSLRIDRRYKGVGRIQRPSGTNDPKEFEKILVMLSNLSDTGRFDILKDIQSGAVSPLEVYSHWKTQNLASVPSTTQLRPIVPTVTDWFENEHDIADTTKKGYVGAFQTFAKFAGTNEPIKNLPDLLGKYKKHCADRNTKRMFNLVRSAVQAFLNGTEGIKSQIYADVVEVKAFKKDNNGDVGTRLSVKEFFELEGKLDSKAWVMVRAMTLTGMGWKEYTQDGYEILEDRILIHGKKRENRDRAVPLVDRIDPPTFKRKAFASKLSEAREGLAPYDFRRTYAHWMEEAGIPRTRRMLYMGHEAKDIHDLYERKEVDEFLKLDAEKLRTYISNEIKKLDLDEIAQTAKKFFTL